MCGTVSHGGTNDNRIAAALDRLATILEKRLPREGQFAHTPGMIKGTVTSSTGSGNSTVSNIEWTDEFGVRHIGYQWWDWRDSCWRGGPHGSRPE